MSGDEYSSDKDKVITRGREIIAAGLGIAIVLVTCIMIFLAFGKIGNGDGTAFAQAKDLLLFLNPLAGVVVGYYFTKVSIERRAEHAEANADLVGKSLSDTRQDLQSTRQVALDLYMNATPFGATPGTMNQEAGVLGDPATTSTNDQARRDLQGALDRAKSVLHIQ